MATLYTKEGRPLRQSGSDLFSRSGTHVAKLKGKKAYGPDGRTSARSSATGSSTDPRTAQQSGRAFAQRAHAGSAERVGRRLSRARRRAADPRLAASDPTQQLCLGELPVR